MRSLVMQYITIVIVSISLLPCFALMLTEYVFLFILHSGPDTLNKRDEV